MGLQVTRWQRPMQHGINHTEDCDNLSMIHVRRSASGVHQRVTKFFLYAGNYVQLSLTRCLACHRACMWVI